MCPCCVHVCHNVSHLDRVMNQSPAVVHMQLHTHMHTRDVEHARHVHTHMQARTIAKRRQRMAHHLDDKNKMLLEGPGSNPTEGYGTGEGLRWLQYR
jgi:Zn-finger nucleic acid-binding protein